jgi:NlpC/P60 family putative phage cell wall peptidase
MSTPSRAIGLARAWLGTPFRAGASLQGVGTDCAGLIEGLARALDIPFPKRAAVEHDFARAAAASLVRVDIPQPGALILLARDPGGDPLHGAIVTDTGTIIHAHWRAGVVENRLGNWFTRRITHIFAWPDIGQLKDT